MVYKSADWVRSLYFFCHVTLSHDSTTFFSREGGGGGGGGGVGTI